MGFVKTNGVKTPRIKTNHMAFPENRYQFAVSPTEKPTM